MAIPISQDTISCDQFIQILDPIRATTSGVKVVTDQLNVVTPLRRNRYAVCANARTRVAAIWT